MVAEVLRRPGEQRGAVDVCKRWQRKFPGTLSLERIPALDDCPVQVAGLARGAADALESVKAGFEFLIADAEILDRHAVGYEALAIALRNVALEAQFLRKNAPDARIGEVRIGILFLAPLEGDYFQAGFGEFHPHDGAGPAETDEHRVELWLPDIDHRNQPFPPATPTGPSG